MSETNGVVQQADVPSTALDALAGVSPAVLQAVIDRANAVYTENQQRDGNAVWHAWAWMRAFFVMLLVWMATAGAWMWVQAHAKEVEVRVQTVVVDWEHQRVVELGRPVKALDYEVEDGTWKDMLREWVHKRVWRTDEKEQKLAKAHWAWLYAHTCGMAAEKLQEDERREKPFITTTVVRSVQTLTTTKTPTPHSFQTLWTDWTLDRSKAKKDAKTHTVTFTVGRTTPTEMNNLGLCVTSYDIQDHES